LRGDRMSEQDEIDYRDLLRRYVDHVGQSEEDGRDFISKLAFETSGVPFSAAEIAELQRMSDARMAVEINDLRAARQRRER
jgi:hypothetical protein